MPLSQAALQGALRSATELVFLELLEIQTEFTTVRLVNDSQDFSNALGTWQRFPLQASLSQGESKPPQLKITADTVDQRLINELRSIAGSRADVLMVYRVVTDQEPNTLQYGPSTFVFESMSTNGYSTVTLTCSFLRAALSDAYPSQQISPASAGPQ